MVERIEVLTVLDNDEIAAGESLFSQMIDMERKEGFGSVHVATGGSGTLRIRYQLSNDVKTAKPDEKSWVYGTTDIVTGHAAGTNLYSMPDEAFFAKFLRFEFIETTTTDAVTGSAWVSTQ